MIHSTFKHILISTTLMLIGNLINAQISVPFSYINTGKNSHYNLINKATNVVMCENVGIDYNNTGGNNYNCTYHYTRSSTPYPFSVMIPHTLVSTISETQVSPISLVEPMVCRYNPANSSLTYTGSSLVYPSTMNVGQFLPVASGTATITAPNGFILTINIEVTDRQLLCIKEMSVGGQMKKVFTFFNKVQTTSMAQGNTISSDSETVVLEVIDGGGIYSIDRSGAKGHTYLQFLN